MYTASFPFSPHFSPKLDHYCSVWGGRGKSSACVERGKEWIFRDFGGFSLGWMRWRVWDSRLRALYDFGQTEEKKKEIFSQKKSLFFCFLGAPKCCALASKVRQKVSSF